MIAQNSILRGPWLLTHDQVLEGWGKHTRLIITADVPGNVELFLEL